MPFRSTKIKYHSCRAEDKKKHLSKPGQRQHTHTQENKYEM